MLRQLALTLRADFRAQGWFLCRQQACSLMDPSCTHTAGCPGGTPSWTHPASTLQAAMGGLCCHECRKCLLPGCILAHAFWDCQVLRSSRVPNGRTLSHFMAQTPCAGGNRLALALLSE